MFFWIFVYNLWNIYKMEKGYKLIILENIMGNGK